MYSLSTPDVKSGQEDCQESSPAFHQENSEQFGKLQPVDSKVGYIVCM